MTGEIPLRLEYDLRGKRVWVSGHGGMVGSALVRRLKREDCETLTVPRNVVDLTRQTTVANWMEEHRPQVVIIAAAKVGGILANLSYPAEFIYENLTIESNIIHASWQCKVEKLLFLGSSCIYPKNANQPIHETSLLQGPLEDTNQWYALAKIAGLKLCEAYRSQYGCDFISAMPTNLYGPEDNFDLASGHVMPALIRKAHEAKARGDSEIVLWGTGNARREFLHVDDCADALVHLIKTYSEPSHINVGSGSDLTILELVKLVCDVVGFRGAIVHDLSKPDGVPRKLLDNTRLRMLGWQPSIGLRDGIARNYADFLRSIPVPVKMQAPQAFP